MSDRKSPGERANYDPIVYKDMQIAWDGQRRGPDLPRGFKWSDTTKEWWETIRCSAQAMAFLDTDWHYMLDVARLHNKLWGKIQRIDRQGNTFYSEATPGEATSLAAEIRQRLAPYGITWASRRKYGIDITNDDQITTEAEQVTRSAAEEYRQRLASGLSTTEDDTEE